MHYDKRWNTGKISWILNGNEVVCVSLQSIDRTYMYLNQSYCTSKCNIKELLNNQQGSLQVQVLLTTPECHVPKSQLKVCQCTRWSIGRLPVVPLTQMHPYMCDSLGKVLWMLCSACARSYILLCFAHHHVTECTNKHLFIYTTHRKSMSANSFTNWNT